jgi:hypothetical protein
VQDFINKQQGFNFRLLVQRVSIDVIGPEAAPNPEPVSGEESVPKPQALPLPPAPPPVAPTTTDQPMADKKPPLTEN